MLAATASVLVDKKLKCRLQETMHIGRNTYVYVYGLSCKQGMAKNRAKIHERISLQMQSE